MASFYLDNNLTPLLAVALRNLGHTAVHVRDLGYRHAKDYEHLIFAAQLGATLITHVCSTVMTTFPFLCPVSTY